MKRGILLTLLTFCLFVIFASYGFSQQTKPEHTLKIASIIPGLTTWGTALSKATDRVYEKTNGKLRVVLYLGFNIDFNRNFQYFGSVRVISQ